MKIAHFHALSHFFTQVPRSCIFKLKTLCFGFLLERLFFIWNTYRYCRFSVKTQRFLLRNLGSRMKINSCSAFLVWEKRRGRGSSYESNLLIRIEGLLGQLKLSIVLLEGGGSRTRKADETSLFSIELTDLAVYLIYSSL